MSELTSQLMILAADRASPLEAFDAAAASIGARMVYGAAARADQIEELAEDVDAVIVFRTPVSASAIARMRNCKIILRQGIGFDLVDVPAATRAGIFVSNVPDYCIEEVASHAVALMLASIRNLLGYHRVMTVKGWGYYNSARRAVPPLDQMRLGIVGLGKIGRSMARKSEAFGIKVSAFDPYLHQDIFDALGVDRIRQFDDLLRYSDIISVHAPLTPETNGLFGAREFALMKPNSYFINTARGKIVNLSALQKALTNGPLAAAGIDVFEDEPLSADHPILKLDNAIVTPHVAFYSERSIKLVVDEAIAEVVRALRGERPLNLVNPEVYSYMRSRSGTSAS